VNEEGKKIDTAVCRPWKVKILFRVLEMFD
jgi:hypothetical protein